MSLRRENAKMVGKLVVIAAGMFAFGYVLIPIYKHICEMTGINILSLSERQVPGNGVAGKDVKLPANTQVDKSRTITVEFDANARGPWDFKPAQRSVQVHPGELTTVMYEFQNVQNRRMAAQAVPSYAPRQATAYFNKLECFCFSNQTIPAGKTKMRKDHLVPLSRQSIAILEDLRTLTGPDGYVFPSIRSRKRPMSDNTINAGLRRLGYSTDEMTAHGFRAMASTLLNESGKWHPDAIERALAHGDSDRIRAAYHRGAHWKERVAMAQWWSDHLDQLRKGAEVVPIKAGKR